MMLARFLKVVIKSGDLCLIDARGRDWRFGDGTAPHVTVQIHDRTTQWRFLLNAELSIGEAYKRGSLTIERGTLYDFIDLAMLNFEYVTRHPSQAFFSRASRFFRRLQQHNPVGKAQRNVSHHYDLSDDLYDLFLDEDRQYSCAYFDSDSTGLEQAQLNKKRHIAAKLLLNRPGLEILDIGSGWGGLGLYLAQQAGARVTGITLSTEQHKVSEQRAADAGLSEQVAFQLRDYRQQTGTFDRIVSVGMFEHVGAGHYTEFFNQVRDLLADDGVCLLHSIGRMERPGATGPWVLKYIFPGGYVPALSEVLAAVEKAGLWVTDIEILRLHYAETLRHWHERFQAQREKARELYDEEFCRMWEFYLVGSEISFRRRGHMVFQLQVTKRQDAVPLTRDYIGEWERSVVAVENRAAE
jgi:cyclopropane-fatty-acyl-phospholipid synthase